jgi:peptidoglycan/LPS O-acetylase OafA/YrhL
MLIPAKTVLRSHLPTLDSLRGVAILLVLIFHFKGEATGTNWLGHAVAAAGHFGWVGVDLFFALSGFLITRILLDHRDSDGYYRNFYARRTLRIFPLYYAALVAVMLVAPALHVDNNFRKIEGGGTWWLWVYLTNVGLVVSPHHTFAGIGSTLTHFWSLAVEEHFYLVWPFLVARLGSRGLGGACVAGIAGALAFRCAAFASGADWETAYYLTPMRVDALMAGALLALLERNGRLPQVGLALAGCAACTAAFVGLCLFAGSAHPQHPLVGTIGISLAAAAAACAVAVAARLPQKRIPGGAALAVMGKYSYGMYVWHLAMLYVMSKYGGRALATRLAGTGVVADLLFIVIASAATFAVAVVSYHAFEQHFLKLKRFFEAPRTAQTTNASTTTMVVNATEGRQADVSNPLTTPATSTMSP